MTHGWLQMTAWSEAAQSAVKEGVSLKILTGGMTIFMKITQN